jgi:chromosome partitioning protein
VTDEVMKPMTTTVRGVGWPELGRLAGQFASGGGLSAPDLGVGWPGFPSPGATVGSGGSRTAGLTNEGATFGMESRSAGLAGGTEPRKADREAASGDPVSELKPAVGPGSPEAQCSEGVAADFLAAPAPEAADAARPGRVTGATSPGGALTPSEGLGRSERDAIAMRGDGGRGGGTGQRGVRAGLGWPEVSSADLRLVTARHGAGELAAIAITPPVQASGELYEVGLGWPGSVPMSHGRHERSWPNTGGGAADDRTPTAQPAVSRETTTAAGPGGGLGYPEPAAGDRSSLTRAQLSAPAGQTVTPASGEPPTSGAKGVGRQERHPAESQQKAHAGDEFGRPRVVPRHAVVRRPRPRNGTQETHGFDIGVEPGPPEETRAWTPSAEVPNPGAWTFQGSGSPMIAGTYSGARIGRGESEDEVAIPGPDTSADTPIARAAQAAMTARAGGQDWPRPESCRILTIANQKGGVGKTTTAVNLAASLAMNGSRVLVVDLDPQGNASTALDVEHRSGTASIYNVLVEGAPLTDVIRPVEGYPHLLCAPATIDLAGSEIELVPLVARESRLARALSGYDASELDYIFIDCPPSLGLLTVNALVAAPEVLIPIQCEYYALEGLEQLLRTIELVKNHLNPTLGVSTILLTMYDSRTRLASQVADEVRGHFGELVLGSVIPRSVRVSEAPSYGQSVMTYDPGSSGALAYLEAAREMAFRNVRAARA